jgi:hypothetical protein
MCVYVQCILLRASQRRCAISFFTQEVKGVALTAGGVAAFINDCLGELQKKPDKSNLTLLGESEVRTREQAFNNALEK